MRVDAIGYTFNQSRTTRELDCVDKIGLSVQLLSCFAEYGRQDGVAEIPRQDTSS